MITFTVFVSMSSTEERGRKNGREVVSENVVIVIGTRFLTKNVLSVNHRKLLHI